MLETRTKSLEGSLKRKAIDYDSLSSNADSLQQKLSSARERVQKLELDREFFLSRQQELQERLESVEKEKAAQILALQTTVSAHLSNSDVLFICMLPLRILFLCMLPLRAYM